jgi:hypothetical protein
MTQAEYTRLYKRSHAKNGVLTLRAKKRLLKTYKEAASLAAKEVAKATEKGLSNLTSTYWKNIEKQLTAGADLIAKELEIIVPDNITKGYRNFYSVDREYILDATKAAKVTDITRAGLDNMAIKVNDDLLKIQINRTSQNGYKFVDSVWSKKTILAKDGITKLPTSVHADYQFRIKNIINTGIAQGRDSVKIAKDITDYAAKGKDFVFKEGRYGKLKPGTAEFKKRITEKVDWRALRLVRSEMNASLQQAGVMEGQLNPAATKFYDWEKTVGNAIDPDGSRNSSGLRCIDLQANSPYPEEEVPSYQHSNCSCHVRPVLMDQDKFVDDLKDWNPGGEPAYLNDWYNDQYLAVN